MPRRQYTEAFKTDIARLVQLVQQHEAARWLGASVATLGNWARRKQKEQQQTAQANTATALKRSVSALEAEHNRLRNELANAKLGRTI